MGRIQIGTRAAIVLAPSQMQEGTEGSPVTAELQAGVQLAGGLLCASQLGVCELLEPEGASSVCERAPGPSPFPGLSCL